VADWPPQGWPPPVDPMLMGAPVPMAPPAPTLDVWPPPEYAELGALLPPAPAPMPPDPVMAANEQLLAQPVAPPAEDAPWPPAEWAPPAPEAPQEAAPAPQQRPQRQAPPPGYGERVQQTGSMMEDSLLREGEYEARAADKRAEGMAQQARVARDYEAQAEQRAMERKADLDQRWQALQAERQQIANTKIEPQRLYADMDTGSRLAWGIAAGIAGALGTINGSGRNLVMEHINRQIDLDIDAQKANLANRRGALGDGMSLYQQLVVKYGDEEQAAGMMKAAALDRIAMEFESQAAQYANPIAKENALQGAVAARQQADAIVQDSAVKAEQRAIENKMQERSLGIQAYNAKTGRMNVEMDYEAAQRKAEVEMAKLNKEQRQSVLFDPQGRPIVDKKGNVVVAPDPKVALEERKKQNAAYSLYESATAYERLLADAEREFGGMTGLIGRSDVLARLDQMHGDMMIVYKNAEGMGALDAGAIQVFNKVMPPPSTWTNSTNPVPGVRQFRDTWKSRKNNEMRQVYGYQGNWVDDFEEGLSTLEPGATKGDGNRQGWKFESVWFVDDQGVPNKSGRGRPMTDGEVEALRRKPSPAATSAETQRAERRWSPR
jgi:hypothetical protein